MIAAAGGLRVAVRQELAVAHPGYDQTATPGQDCTRRLSSGVGLFREPRLGEAITERSGESSASGVFVGRAHALAELDAALDEAEVEQGSLVLVTGDPGIGKTRLASELIVRARSRGIVALRGTCWEGGGAPAYWPWAQVLRDWIRVAGATSLDDLGVRSADLAALLPELRGDAPTTSGAPDAERDRFRLFDALADTLLRGSERQPMLVVLDDLHWADTPSVLALRFLAGELHHGRLVVVGAYRDLEVHHGHPLVTALGDLARIARRLPLPGLAPAEVARYIAIATGVEPASGVVASVSRQTGGNPLFVRELVRLARQEGSIDSLAAGPPATPVTPAGVPSRWAAVLPAVRQALPRHRRERQPLPVPLLHLLHPPPLRHRRLQRRPRTRRPARARRPAVPA